MKGRRSVLTRTRELEDARACRPLVRTRYDFSAFPDDELEALMVLAERAAEAGGKPIWTPEELATLERLNAKLAAATGGPR